LQKGGAETPADPLYPIFVDAWTNCVLFLKVGVVVQGRQVRLN
jgi:hypothetical protein